MATTPDPAGHPAETGSASDELLAVGRLAGAGLRGLVQMVGDTHAAISRRVEQHLPPTAQSASAMATERAISTAVYSILQAASRHAPVVAAGVAAQRLSPDAPPLSRSAAGIRSLPFANGLWGDRVAAVHRPLEIPMAVRVAGGDLPLHPEAVAAAYPAATGRVVVFLHGLSGDERWWHLPMDESTDSYGDRLARDHGFTPVLLRYNSGLHVSENGRKLSELLDELVAAWPVSVESLALVGHSMGGLVARSAAHVGDTEATSWAPLMRTLVTLGTPHLGSPLEKVVHVSERLLRLFPESEPFSRPFAIRSAGIKDTRYGAVVEEDWLGHDPDEFLRNRCTDVPLLPHVTYYWVAATLTRDREHPAARLVGDGLVSYPSASGEGRHRRIPFDIDNGVHVGSVGHLRLLNHPAVYERLAAWLTAPAPESTEGADRPAGPPADRLAETGPESPERSDPELPDAPDAGSPPGV